MQARSFERFQNVQELGRGGMGVVYRAWDRTVSHPVALKRLRADLADRRHDTLALFHREYRLLSELRHPSVIEVYDFGVDGTGPFYTMELLDGEDLRKRAPVPWREACALARDVCSSLALLHARSYIHRDVSPLNIRRTTHGRAKLLDFGAMTPGGVTKLIVGTPPCLPPEALLKQPLDGRSDLFSLGATLYWCLTGRHAFHTRDFAQLRALWAQRPPPPSRYAPDVPAALDSLILTMLSIDPAARPRSAAEVMDRLTVLAELPSIEQQSVLRSYLSTPALVGRGQQLQTFRCWLERLSEGRGAAVRLLGAPGDGRTRLLDGCALEAKLRGIRVCHVSAGEGGRRPYATLAALLAEARSGAGLGGESSVPLEPELSAIARTAAHVVDDSQTRPRIHAALRRYFRALTRRSPMVIAIDDLGDCDEASQAAALALADESQRSALLLLYTDTDVDRSMLPKDSNPRSVLRELTSEIAVPPLPDFEVDNLLLSIFGDVPNLPAVAAYMHERCEGSPRTCMELSQWLIDLGLARYDMGSWTLPSQLSTSGLPANVTELRRKKLAALPEPARDVAEVLAFCESYALDASSIAQLCGDPARVLYGIDYLVQTRLLVVHDSGAINRLASAAWADALREAISPQRRQRVCMRLSVWLAQTGADPLLRTDALLQAGQDARAIDTLLGELQAGSRVESAPDNYPALLSRCAAACTRLGRPARDRFAIVRELLLLSDRVTIEQAPQYFTEVFERLQQDSGLSDYAQLTHVADPAARVKQAFERAQARYDAAGEHERIEGPIASLRALAQTAYAAGVYAAIAGDSELLYAIPSLEPFVGLSPALEAVEQAIHAQRALVGARFEEAIALYEARLRTLESPGRGGLDPEQAEHSRVLVLYALGTLHAGTTIEGALRYTQQLEVHPAGEIPAALVLEHYYARLGDSDSSNHWHRRAELLQIQRKRSHALTLSVLRRQAEYAGHADDLPAAKRALALIEEIAGIQPSQVPLMHLARAQYERIRGNYAVALELSRTVLRGSQAGRDFLWPWAAACEIECLREQGQLDLAARVSAMHLFAAERGGLKMMRDHIALPYALTLARLSLLEPAVELLDGIVERRERVGMCGLNLGWAYEARARLALQMHDAAAFAHYSERCAETYRRGNGALMVRHERLLQEARALGVEPAVLQVPGEPERSQAVTLPPRPSVSAALKACGDYKQRGETLLRLLCETVGASHGHLFLHRADGIECVAGRNANAEVVELAHRALDTRSPALATHRYSRPPQPSRWLSIALSYVSDARPLTLGVAILAVVPDELPARQLQNVIRQGSRLLLEHGDAVALER